MAFEFIADRPALDFVATVAERGSTREEKLPSPERLVEWAQQSGIVEDLTAATEEQLRQAVIVREAIYGLISALIDDTAVDPADRATVNAAARRPRPRLELDGDGHLYRTGGLDGLLAALACDCLDLFANPDRFALHWCADRTCTRPFLDRSRGQRRRWCGMRGCGDRAKAAAYRQRRRESLPH